MQVIARQIDYHQNGVKVHRCGSVLFYIPMPRRRDRVPSSGRVPPENCCPGLFESSFFCRQSPANCRDIAPRRSAETLCQYPGSTVGYLSKALPSASMASLASLRKAPGTRSILFILAMVARSDSRVRPLVLGGCLSLLLLTTLAAAVRDSVAITVVVLPLRGSTVVLTVAPSDADWRSTDAVNSPRLILVYRWPSRHDVRASFEFTVSTRRQ